MMGQKAVEPKLYLSFSLDAAVPANHLVRRLAAAVDFSFVRGLVRQQYSHTGQPSVDPVVLFKLWLLGYMFDITSERRLCEESGLNLAWRWFLGYRLDQRIPDRSKLGKAPLLSQKTHFVVDDGKANIITAVAVTGSCESDGRPVGKLLDKHRQAVGRPARELVADRGYGSEAAVLECIERDVTPFLGRRTTTNTLGGLSRSEFTYDSDRDLYLCPVGKELHRFRFKLGPLGAQYRPKAGTCRDCHLRSQCVSGAGDRVIRRSDNAGVLEELEGRLLSSRGRKLMRRRRIVSERINADAKDKHGMARAQFRGRRKMLIQALLTAAVINLKQLAARRPEAHSGMAFLAVAKPTSSTISSRLHRLVLSIRAATLPLYADRRPTLVPSPLLH